MCGCIYRLASRPILCTRSLFVRTLSENMVAGLGGIVESLSPHGRSAIIVLFLREHYSHGTQRQSCSLVIRVPGRQDHLTHSMKGGRLIVLDRARASELWLLAQCCLYSHFASLHYDRAQLMLASFTKRRGQRIVRQSRASFIGCVRSCKMQLHEPTLCKPLGSLSPDHRSIPTLVN